MCLRGCKFPRYATSFVCKWVELGNIARAMSEECFKQKDLPCAALIVVTLKNMRNMVILKVIRNVDMFMLKWPELLILLFKFELTILILVY